ALQNSNQRPETMKPIRQPLLRHLPLTAIILALAVVPLFAKPVPDNLGGGLDKVLENHLIQQGVITTAPDTSRVLAPASQSFATSITKSPRGSRKQMPAASTTTSSTIDFATYKSIIAGQANSYASRAITDPATGN